MSKKIKNKEVAYLSDRLRKGNTGSISIALQYAIGFGPALLLNTLLDKERAYFTAHQKKIKGEDGGYDAIIDGGYFPASTRELIADTALSASSINHHISALAKAGLIATKQTYAKLDISCEKTIRHIKIAKNIEKKILTLSKNGISKVKNEKLKSELVSAIGDSAEESMFLLNHDNSAKNIINRYIAQILQSPEISALYNFLISASIKKRTEENGPLIINYDYLAARFSCTDRTIRTRLKILIGLGLFKSTTAYKKRTAIEPVLSGDLIIDKILNSGAMIVNLLKKSTHDNDLEIEAIRSECFDQLSQNNADLEIINKLLSNAKTYIARNYQWEDEMEDAKNDIEKVIADSTESSFIITSNGKISAGDFYHKCCQTAPENFAFLIIRLFLYRHEVDNLAPYIITTILSFTDKIKRISKTDRSFLIERS